VRSSPHARANGRQTEPTEPPDKAHRTKFPCPVLCPVLTPQHRQARVCHRTHGTCHRACPVHSTCKCPVLPPSLSRAPAHTREHSFTGQEPPDKTRLSGALSGALQSTFLNSFLHPCSQPLTPKCSTTLCTCVSVFTNIFKGVRIFTNNFSKELATQLATPLDPSNDAKLDHSSGTR
jgi:hypothetical protein